MKVYWGYSNSGKGHIKFYGMMNGMNMLFSKFKNFHKVKNKISNRGLSPSGQLWMYRDSEERMYFRKNNNFLSCDNNVSNRFVKIPFFPQDAYINPEADELSKKLYEEDFHARKMKNIIGKKKSNLFVDVSKFRFTEEDVEKYTSDEYKGKNVQYDAFMQYFMLKENTPLGYEMLNAHADEIFDSVDILMCSAIDNFALPKPSGYQYGTGVMEGHYLIQNLGNQFLIPPNVLNKLRNASNIIPYKSDIFDWAVKTIDGFSHLTSHKYKETPPEFYKNDKQLMWGFLDHELNNPIRIAEFLAKHNIPFQYFDLDTDTYNEVFGGDFEIDKNYTSHALSWEGHDDRYNEVANIAKEYISLRNLSQPYTPTKL